MIAGKISSCFGSISVQRTSSASVADWVSQTVVALLLCVLLSLELEKLRNNLSLADVELVVEVVFDGLDKVRPSYKWRFVLCCVYFEHVLILSKCSDGQLVEVDFRCFLARLASAYHLTLISETNIWGFGVLGHFLNL